QNSKLRFFDKFPFFNFLCNALMPPEINNSSKRHVKFSKAFTLAKTLRKTGAKTALILAKNTRIPHAKAAFTLAETLITLAIIGVVAAMTIPSVLNHYREQVVETRLKKIYSVMNQAISLSELDNGSKEFWPYTCSNDEECMEYYEKYILPYLSAMQKYEFQSYNGYNIAIYFADGSLLISKKAYDYFFFPNAQNFDEEKFAQYDENNAIIREGQGVIYFMFSFQPSKENIYYQKGFMPYVTDLDSINEENLLKGNYACTKENKNPAYCTALIWINGWKIPKNYPFKVKV
ncbi:MAG: type II secretion system GspH family protein, partial [Candidatus Gastranaerophilales bacterium]|nr:type II secretion system GspH family protein [Candidatus Gastranaerophilales bacterium]